MRWHPHVGRLDRATDDGTLRWPTQLTLLASGTPVDSGGDDEQRWTRQVLDVPTMGFSFEIDDYDVVTKQVGHFDLMGVIDRVLATLRPGDPARRETDDRPGFQPGNGVRWMIGSDPVAWGGRVHPRLQE